MSTLTIFALCRIPVELAVFGFALWYYRRQRVSCSPRWALATALAGLLATTAGDCFGHRGEKAIWLVFVGFVLICIAALSYLERLKQGGLPSNPIARVIQKITVVAFYCYMLGQVVTYAVNTRDRVRDDQLEKSGS